MHITMPDFMLPEEKRITKKEYITILQSKEAEIKKQAQELVKYLIKHRFPKKYKKYINRIIYKKNMPEYVANNYGTYNEILAGILDFHNPSYELNKYDGEFVFKVYGLRKLLKLGEYKFKSELELLNKTTSTELANLFMFGTN